MGILSAIEGDSAYLDTNVFVYALEEHPRYAAALAELFEAVDAGKLQAVTSELSVAEALVKPFMDEDAELQAAYQRAVRPSASLRVAPVSRRVLFEAARLRARGLRLKLPDAIHVAAAQLAGCETPLTNDTGMKGAPGLHVVICSEVVPP